MFIYNIYKAKKGEFLPPLELPIFAGLVGNLKITLGLEREYVCSTGYDLQ